MKRKIGVVLLMLGIFFSMSSDVEAAEYMSMEEIPIVIINPNIDIESEGIQGAATLSDYKNSPTFFDNGLRVVYEMPQYNYEAIRLAIDYYLSKLNRSGSYCTEFRIWEMTDEQLNAMGEQWGDAEIQNLVDSSKNLTHAYSYWEYPIGTERLWEGNRCYLGIDLNRR